MPHSSFTIHPSEKRGADENGESSLRSHLFLPSGHHQKYLVEINKPSRIWPIHGTIGYKIKQKSILNSKLWSGLSCCLNNNINPGEQSQSRWEVAPVRAPQAGSKRCVATTGTRLEKLPFPLGQSQEGPFYGENFYTEIHLNSERVRARARLIVLEELKLLEFFPPRRFSEPIRNQLALLEC